MNIKNRLSAQVLRIAALALAISLIFGSMAVFYAESDGSSDPTTEPGTSESSTVGSDTTSETSTDETEATGGDTTSETNTDETEATGGDTTSETNTDETEATDSNTSTEPSTGETEATGTADPTGTQFVGYECIRLSIYPTMGAVDTIVDEEGTFYFNLLTDAEVYLMDETGNAICTLEDALNDGAMLRFTASADPVSYAAGKALIVDDEYNIHVDYICFKGAAEGDTVPVYVDLTVTYNGAAHSAKFIVAEYIVDDNQYIDSMEIVGGKSEYDIQVGSTEEIKIKVTLDESNKTNRQLSVQWEYDKSLVSIPEPDDVTIESDGLCEYVTIPVTALKAGSGELKIVASEKLLSDDPAEVFTRTLSIRCTEKGSAGGSDTTSSSDKTTTTTKKATTTTVKGSSADNSSNNPDTGDITAKNDNPGRSAAAIAMLTVGLMIVFAIAAERIIRARADRKRRADAIRR